MGRITAGLAGLLATGAGVAAAELIAAAGRPESGPVVAVGAAVIDLTPTPVKEYAVRTLGTADKPVLLATIAVALAVIAVASGLLARRDRRYALGAGLLFAVAGGVAALSRPAAAWTDVLPSLAGGGAAAAVLLLLLRERPAPATGRRAFLGIAAAVAVAGAGAAVLRRLAGGAAARSREAVTLPAAADPAPPLPAVQPGFVTANADFYRVDTALTVPRLDPDTWRLTIGGMVDNPVTLTFAELLARPLIERHITLNCVSNEVGGPYIGTARWLGVPLAPLLREVGVRAGADQLVARSTEGMTIGTPVATLLDGRDAMLAVGMNGEPLPHANGFPVRMLTPGLYGYAGSCKWVTELELSTFADFDAYWVRRGWAARAPVKTASRIDTPKPFTEVTAGTVVVAGVAWAQHRGISAVEVQVDDGPWRAATLTPVPSTDTWVQWRFPWQATAGAHTLRVRATDSTGAVQTEQRVTPFPDGATGWHTMVTTVVP
jgi:DMSO/TMAO reductase YedYZ molybdopterin-dependent catalytic subunit